MTTVLLLPWTTDKKCKESVMLSNKSTSEKYLPLSSFCCMEISNVKICFKYRDEEVLSIALFSLQVAEVTQQ